jgi:hypothetical protein
MMFSHVPRLPLLFAALPSCGAGQHVDCRAVNRGTVSWCRNRRRTPTSEGRLRMRKLVEVLAVLALSCAPAPHAQSPFTGTWKTDTQKNPPAATGTITYALSPSGKEHYSDNRNSEYEFAIDGKEYPTDRAASTVAWNKSGETAWDCTEKIKDRVIKKIHFVLSPDDQTLTTTYTWFNGGNRTAQGASIFTRLSGGPGLEGTWKMVKRVEEADTVT